MIIKSPFKQVVGVLISLALIYAALLLHMPPAVAFSPEILQFIYLPTCLLSILVIIKSRENLSGMLEAVGIPLGILVSLLLFVSDINSLSEPKDLVPATAQQFMAIFHGCLISALGHLISPHQESNKNNNEKFNKRVLLMVAITLPICFIALSGVPAQAYFSLEPLLLVLSPIPLLIIRGLDSYSPLLVIKGVVMVMLGSAFVSIVGFISTLSDVAAMGSSMAFGILGLLYGSFYLFLMSLLMHSTVENRKIMVNANWHALEIYGLFILILCAPPSFLEFMGAF